MVRAEREIRESACLAVAGGAHARPHRIHRVGDDQSALGLDETPIEVDARAQGGQRKPSGVGRDPESCDLVLIQAVEGELFTPVRLLQPDPVAPGIIAVFFRPSRRVGPYESVTDVILKTHHPILDQIAVSVI